MKLINNHRAYEHGPVRIAELRRKEAAARAMGNVSGANVLRAQHVAAQVRWDTYKARHEPPPMTWLESLQPLTKIDTQGA